MSKHSEGIAVQNKLNLIQSLAIDCEKCFGFCCVALYFSASDGFPVNKVAGKPCPNLMSDFKCTIHNELRNKGLKGCTAYDCFGAGQKVAQMTYGGTDWQKAPGTAQQMFDAFLMMRQIHEMLWYLLQISDRELPTDIQEQIISWIDRTAALSELDAEALVGLDLTAHRQAVNKLLQMSSEIVRTKTRTLSNKSVKGRKAFARRPDFIGKDLSQTDLRGADLSGAILIAANLSGTDLTGAVLIGADLRDTNLKGANLENALFITQGQINTAKGDQDTRLPLELKRPFYWER